MYLPYCCKTKICGLTNFCKKYISLQTFVDLNGSNHIFLLTEVSTTQHVSAMELRTCYHAK